MDFRPIVAPSIRELFIQQLEGAILSGQLKPGDRLPTERELAEALFRYHRGVVFLGGNTITPLLFNAFKKVNLEFWSGYIRSVGREESLRTLARFTDLIAAGQGDEAARLLDDGLRRFVTTL